MATRQRYELIIEEVTVLKDSLERVAEESQGLNDPSAGKEPEDKQPANNEAAGDDKKLTAEEKQKRAHSLRLLRVQRALLQSQKSAQEILGVATTFDDIREELVNNRIDTADRKSRLQEQIAQRACMGAVWGRTSAAWEVCTAMPLLYRRPHSVDRFALCHGANM